MTTVPDAVYVVPDLHGHVEHLRAALGDIDLTNPGVTLVLLGDYIDRGPDSLGVLELLKATHAAHPTQVVALLGNHDTDFLEWLDGDDPSWLLADPDLQTTRSFLSAAIVDNARSDIDTAQHDGHFDPAAVGQVDATIKREILGSHADLIAWLRRRPRFYETPTHIYVHAGIDEAAGDLWKLATPDETFTHKYPPSLGASSIGKQIVAGHVGTQHFHSGDSCGPFVDDGHIYLDGSVERTGQLNVMRYDSATGRTEFRTITASDQHANPTLSA